MKARTFSQRLGRLVIAALMIAWLIVPFLPMVLWAFADRWPSSAAFPTQWGTAGFMAAMAQGGAAAFKKSLILGVIVAAIATPAGAVVGRALALGRAPAPRSLTVLVFAPLLLPALTLSLGMNVLLLRARVPELIGLVLVLVAMAMPYTTFSMRVAYASYDAGYDAEARVLGASRRHTLWHVHLPLIAPALARSAFLAFLVGWSDYIVTLLIGGGQIVTLPLITASAAAGVGNDSLVAVLSLIAIIPPVLVLAWLARQPWRTRSVA